MPCIKSKKAGLGLTLFAVLLILSACGGAKKSYELGWEVPAFNYVNQEGVAFGLEDLKGKVWLADFIFTNCYTVCPPMTKNMVELQEKLKEAGVQAEIVSFSVDPEVDTPEVLKEYAQRYNLDFNNWNFLTGYTYEELVDFSFEGFKAFVEREADTDQVIHVTSFFLVDQSGTIVTRYDGYLDTPYDKIIQDIQALQR